MLRLHRILLLSAAALLFVGFAGCGEDNEKAAGVNKPGVAPSNAPTNQEDYYKKQQANNPYAGGGGYPGTGK